MKKPPPIVWSQRLVKSCLPTFRVRDHHGRPVTAYVRDGRGELATVKLQNGSEVRLAWSEIADSINGRYALTI